MRKRRLASYRSGMPLRYDLDQRAVEEIRADGRYFDGNPRLTNSERLASYISKGDFGSPLEGAARAMLEVRDALGTDAAGQAGFNRVLAAGQYRSGAPEDPARGELLRQAFAHNVAMGKIGVPEIRAMVDAQAQSASRVSPF